MSLQIVGKKERSLADYKTNSSNAYRQESMDDMACLSGMDRPLALNVGSDTLSNCDGNGYASDLTRLAYEIRCLGDF